MAMIHDDTAENGAIAATTIPRVFARTLERDARRRAMRYKEFGLWHDLSWREYHENIRALGLALVSLGFEKGDRVAIIGDNCAQWIFADMATLCMGGVSVGVYSTNAAEQCEYVVTHSGAKFYFVENEEQLDKWLAFRDRAPGLHRVIVWELKGLRDFKDPQVMTFGELMELGRAEAAKDPGRFDLMGTLVSPSDPALFIYTSGTTGKPKGAVLSHRNITWIAEAIMRVNPLNEDDEVLSYLPLCHVFERIFSVFSHVRFGYTLNFIESLETVTDNMREVSPTVGYAVPRIWEKYHASVVIGMSDATWFKRKAYTLAMAIGTRRMALLQEGPPPSLALETLYRLAHFAVFRKLKERLGFERLRVAYSGAAPIAPDVLRFFNAIGVPLLEGYGQTEATGVTTVNRLGTARIGTVGRPLPGVTVRIADDGEIMVDSPGVFLGYYNEPALTAESLEGGWLLTGDLGAIDEEGNLRITGRKKDIIITAGGKNITPQYIEGKLIFSPYVSDAIVIGDGRKYLTAIIVLDEENAVKYAQDRKIPFATYRDLTQCPEIVQLLREHVDRVNDSLSRVEHVKKFTILPHKLYQEEGDVTPTMKVKRRDMMRKYKDMIDSMYRG